MPVVSVMHVMVWKDSGAFFMARSIGNDAANITQASITGITCKVIDSGGTTVATPTVDKATSVFDTLQTDDRWPADSTGYNFGFAMGDDVFTTGGETYRVEFMCDPVLGADFPIGVYSATARNLLGS